MLQRVTYFTTATTITLGASTHGEPFNSTVVIKNTTYGLPGSTSMVTTF